MNISENVVDISFADDLNEHLISIHVYPLNENWLMNNSVRLDWNATTFSIEISKIFFSKNISIGKSYEPY